jgi:hypothetical protein
MPNSAPVPERGPTINRDQERARLLTNLGQAQTTQGAQPRAPQPTNSAQSPQSPELPSAPAQASDEAIAQTHERPTTSGEVNSHSKHSSLQSTQSAPDFKNGEQVEEKQGLLGRVLKQLSALGDRLLISELAAKVTGLMNAAIPKLGAWARPHLKAAGRESLNIKPPPEASPREEWRSLPETKIVAPLEEKSDLALEKAQKQSLTEQALTTVAAATQSKIEEKEKKQADAESETKRNKDSAQAALRKLQLEGLSPAELAEISAELTSVYGTAEVALRNARELLTRKKPS